MPLFFLLAACIALILVGAGIVFAVVAVVATAVMVALGITSSAVLIGLLRRNFASGLRALHYQILCVLGIPAGIALVGIAVWILDSDVRRWEVFAIGALGGACAGLALAWVSDRLAGVVYQRFEVVPDRADVWACDVLKDSSPPRG